MADRRDRSRMRALLSDYYGIDGEGNNDDDAASSAAESASGEQNSHDGGGGGGGGGGRDGGGGASHTSAATMRASAAAGGDAAATSARGSGSGGGGGGGGGGRNGGGGGNARAPRRKNKRGARWNDMNSAQFDAEAYFENIVQNESMDALISTDERLRSDIRSLDSQMKTLVHENYHKFITATDTIKTMKENVEGMRGEMTKLEERMSTLCTHADTLEQKLAPQQNKVRQLGTVYELLQKLQFIVELPSRLESAMAARAYDQVAEQCAPARALFTRFAHLASFQSLSAQCDAVFERLREQLREQIGAVTKANALSETDQVCNACEWLIEMEYPQEEVLEMFLQWHAAAFDALTDDFTRETTTLRETLRTKSAELASQGDGADGKDKGDADVNGEGAARASPALLKLLSNYAEATRALLTRHCDRFVSILSDCDRVARGCVGDAEGATIDARTKSHLSRLLNTMREYLLKLENTELLLDGLQIIYSALERANANVPNLALPERAADLANSTVINAVDGTFDALHSAIDERLQRCSSNLCAHPTPSAPTLAADAASVCADVDDTLLRAVQHLRTYIAHENNTFMQSQSSNFKAKIQVKLQQLLLSVNVLLTEECAASRDDTTAADACYKLVLLHLAKHFQSTLIERSVRALQDLLKQGGGGGESFVHASDLVARFEETSDIIVQAFVSLAAKHLTFIVQDGFQREFGVNENGEAHKVTYTEFAKLYLDQINLFRGYVDEFGFTSGSATVGGSGGGGGAGGGGTHANPFDNGSVDNATATADASKRARSTGGSFSSNLGIFSRRVDFYVRAEANANSVMQCAALRSLKSFIEIVRFHLLCDWQYKQVQVSLELWRVNLSKACGLSHYADLEEAIKSALAASAARVAKGSETQLTRVELQEALVGYK